MSNQEQDVAKKIVDYIGGAENVETFTHCATRLRFTIKNEEKIDQESLKALKEVLGIVNKGGMFQIVIGPTVERLYNQMTPLLSNVAVSAPVEDKEAAAEDANKKNTVFTTITSYISGAISPTLPVLIGAGMINSVLAIATLFGLDKSGSTYTTWSSIATIAFTYLPVFVAFAAARKVRTNEYLAAMIALAMVVCFNQQTELAVFGLSIPEVKYANCIIPFLLMVPFMTLIDKFCDKFIPAAAHFTIKPLIVVGITAPVTMFVFGPIGAAIGGALANGCIWLMNTVGSLSMAVISGLHPLMVMFGMHYLFTPIFTNELAETGATFILNRALAANFAMAGAALAVGVKAKKPENKSVGFSASVTALLSVTEPALYGCLIRLRKPLISACIASALAGLFIGAFKIVAYSIATPCLLGLPIYIGGDSMTNFVLACIAAALAFALGFVVTYIIGFDED